jgi:ABC-type multidrug transport system ATPase subunit
MVKSGGGGVGKTALIKVLTGGVQPSSGRRQSIFRSRWRDM